MYEGTPERSPGRQILVDFWAYRADATFQGVKRVTTCLPLEFVDDLFAVFVERRWLFGHQPY